MSTFPALIERMASNWRDWEDLATEERMALVKAHMERAADEYASEALTEDDVRTLAALIASMDERRIGNFILAKFGNYAKRSVDYELGLDMPAFLRRQAG